MRRLADAFAISCSGLCALHCVFAPAALVLVPLFGAGVLEDAGFHRAILWLVLPASAGALALGCARHQDRAVLLVGALGLAVIAAGGLFAHDLLGETGEKVLTFLGSVVLIAGHVRNYALCRAAACRA
jgi:p-aminobenzoyl-glutamate transporter AbgT